MNTEESMVPDNEPDEQFKYVRQGQGNQTLTRDQSGVRTIVFLMAAFIALMGVDGVARYLRTSHRVPSSTISPEVVAALPYFCAVMIFATCVVASAFLLLILWCVRLWFEADLSPRAIKVILFGLSWLIVLIATTAGSLWWFYSI